MYQNNIIHLEHMNPSVAHKREVHLYRLAAIYTAVITTVEALVTIAIGLFTIFALILFTHMFLV